MTIAAPLSAEEIQPAGGSKLIAITFDDGPGKYTGELLDALKKYNAKATFFLVGTCVERYPELVKREVEEGHQVANRSWDHAKLTDLSQSAISAELSKTENAIDKACGKDLGTLMVRPPYGSSNSAVQNSANAPLIFWSVDTLDWKYRNAETVKNNIVNNAKDGAIILLHDIHSTSVQGAVAAIEELTGQGYTFVTVSELFRRKGITMSNGTGYHSAPANGVDLGPIDPYAYDETRLSEHWAYEYINYTKENGLMKGISDNAFGPEYPMTRAMFATVICRLSGEKTAGCKNPFSDIKEGEWYTESIAWAAEKGIVHGVGNGKFAPQEYVTREQAAVMIANFLSYCGIESHSAAAAAFSDQDQISEWAKESVAAITGAGIMNGMGDGTFRPQSTATRAQAAVILTKVHQRMRNMPSGLLKMSETPLLSDHLITFRAKRT